VKFVIIETCPARVSGFSVADTLKDTGTAATNSQIHPSFVQQCTSLDLTLGLHRSYGLKVWDIELDFVIPSLLTLT